MSLSPKLQSMVDALALMPSSSGIVEFDSGKIIAFNPQFELTFGWKNQDLVGQHQSAIHPPLDSEEQANTFNQHRQILLHDGRVEGLESIVVCADGRHKHVEITASLLRVEGMAYMIGVFHVTDKRHAALMALKDKTEELEALFENSQVGIMLLTGYRVLHRGNQRLADILGYASPQEMLGISMRQLHLSEERFVAYGKANYDTLAYRKNLHVEYQLRKKNGDAVWCRLSGMALDRQIPADLSKGVIWVVDDISDIKITEQIIESERNLFRSGPTVVFQWRPTEGWPIHYVSDNVEQVFGYSKAQLLERDGQCFAELIHPDDLHRIGAEVADHLQQKNTSFEQFYRLRIATGAFRYFYDHTLIEYDEQGELQSLYGYLIDMTEYLEAQEMSSLLMSSTNEGIFGIDAEGITTFINPAAARMLGYSDTELLNKSNHHTIHHSQADGSPLPSESCRMMLPISSGEDEVVIDEVLWRKDGTSFPVEYRSTPIMHDQHITGTVVTFHDISDRKAQERRIEYLAYHDELTGLPNRRLFNDRLNEEIKQEKRHPDRSGLLFLDIDHFKDINDTLGHPVGDALLQEVSQRIQNLLRETDTLARLGGDEFAIFLVRESGHAAVQRVAERVIEAFSAEFTVLERPIQVTTSVGVTFCDPAFNAEEIIAQADIALYQAKESGRNNFVVYKPEMSASFKQEVAIVGELRHSIQQGEFSNFYQPQVDPLTRQVVGLEALIRWFPEAEYAQTMNSPAQFIPVAEKRGLILEITLWQIQKLAEEMADIKKAGFQGRVSINISGELVSREEHLSKVINSIKNSALSCTDLCFEITETAYSELSDKEKRLLNEVQENGVELAIDDFGTGYSSLASLRLFKSRHLKIDKSFIDNVHSSEDDRAIVSATISMAHQLGKSVVAEGVETEPQLEVLKSLGCDVIQGYWFARPMPLEPLCEYLRTQSGLNS